MPSRAWARPRSRRGSRGKSTDASTVATPPDLGRQPATACGFRAPERGGDAEGPEPTASPQFTGYRGIEVDPHPSLTSLAMDCVTTCETKLIVIDDLHFVDFRHRNGLEVSNHLKGLANVLPATFLFVGVNLEAKKFFDEGLLGRTQRMHRRVGAPRGAPSHHSVSATLTAPARGRIFW